MGKDKEGEEGGMEKWEDGGMEGGKEDQRKKEKKIRQADRRAQFSKSKAEEIDFQ